MAAEAHGVGLIAVVGATATGKTAAGVALAVALNGEIVGADSRQVYRGMPIGTAQPSRDELAAAHHHLIGFLPPDAPFGLAGYLDVAGAAIAEIQARNHRPILVGGTGQYVWALVEGWTVPRVAPDLDLRSELQAFVRLSGAGALHARLDRVDPAAAAAIHPNNVRRVVRALEVYEHTGTPISAQQRSTPGSDVLVIGLSMPRDVVYQRADRRVERMYQAGMLDEVRALDVAGYARHLPSMASIGYPEAWAVYHGELSTSEAILRTQLATHRLVRQQQTWFRGSDPRIAWIDAAGDAPAHAVEIAAGQRAAMER